MIPGDVDGRSGANVQDKIERPDGCLEARAGSVV